MGQGQEIGVVADFRIRIGIFAVICLAGAAFIAAFAMDGAHQKEIAFAAATIGGVAAVYSGYYAGESLRRQVKLAKMKNAHDLLGRIHTPEGMRARALLDKFDAGSVKPAELHETIVTTPDLHVAVKSLLNSFEAIAIGVRTGYADEEVAYLSISSLAEFVVKSFHPYIEKARERLQDPNVYLEIEQLTQSWGKKRFLTTGKPITSDLAT